MMEGQDHGVYCNPTTSFDGVGSFHKLGEYDSIEFHFVEESSGNTNTDEEQGFEAVLELGHLQVGKVGAREDVTIAESGSEVNVPDWKLYQREKLARVVKDSSLNSTTRRDAVFKLLEGMGVKTFIVVSGREDNTTEIVQRVRDVIDFVSVLKRSGLHKLRPCLLFQDTDGLLYNLVVPKQAAGPFEQFQANFAEFSCAHALVAISIVSRTFACIQSEEKLHYLAFLGLVIGLLLSEETSLSWLNASLLVQGIPSTSSHVLINGNGFDWIHKGSISCLVFAGATQGNMQILLHVTGASLACVALLVNLGSRAWHFLHLRPISFGGPLASYFAFVAAFFVGLCFPHMGHRNVEGDSKIAIETITNNAFWVGSLFLLSSFGAFQKLLLGGNEFCEQSFVNITVGSWLGATLLLNLLLAASNIRRNDTAHQGAQDLILIEDHSSPVGFCVPNFPAITIDPNQAMKGAPLISLEYEMYGGVFVALVIMAIMLSLPFSNWTSTLEAHIADALNNLVQ